VTGPAPGAAAPPATTSASGMRPVGLVALFVTFLAIAAVLRAPTLSNHVFNSDEAYLATEAQIIDDGGHLYADAVDRKPPIVPYLYAAVFRATGSDDLAPVRAVAILAQALTALLLAAEARRRFGGRHTDLLVGVLYLAAATAFRPQDAQAAGFEVFMLPLMTAAVVLGARRRPAASGVVLAIATLTKQTAITALLPLAWLAWRARRARGLVLLTIAFVFPILVAAAVFGFHDFFFWVFTGSGNYLDASGVLGYAAGLGAKSTAWFLFGSAALVVLAAAAWPHRRDDADLWLWLLAGVVAVAAGLRFFPHYYLQLLPPLALLAGRGVSACRWFTRRAGVLLIAVLAIAPLVWFLPSAFAARTDRNLRLALDAAAYVRAHTKPGDRVLVWGQAPEVYWTSDRRPATRFPTTAFVTGASGGRPADHVGPQYATPGAMRLFLDDLREHPPALIVDMSSANQRNAGAYPPRTVPAFSRFLAHGGWRRIARVDGADILRSTNHS
jgi:4-amino-4-deoxy-L-arabinose transferase-like glycosyltransferase